MATKGILFSAAVVVSMVVVSGAFGSELCPKPRPNLKMGTPNVDAETFNFFYQSEQFPVDVYSGFASQYPGGGSNFCIRYEAENKGSNAIVNFYWPLANDFQQEKFEPKQRASIAVTVPPGQPPAVKDTWLYAFKSDKKKSRAYQTNLNLQRSPARFAELSTLRTNAAVLSDSPNPGLRLVQNDKPSSAIKLTKPDKFPLIGAQYSGSGADVIATSRADWDGKVFKITMTISRNDEKMTGKVRAPFMLSMWKAVKPEAMIAEFRGVDVPFSNDAFEYTNRYTSVGSLFVVRQPIILEQPTGRVCFLAASYSPTPINENYQKCDLFKLSR